MINVKMKSGPMGSGSGDKTNGVVNDDHDELERNILKGINRVMSVISCLTIQVAIGLSR